ncbi:hypothetical protein ACMA1D_29730 [Streptomyces sp. 796.1]|uniref:hypothetical protein n=1 Tax=Streptomyces sp. 796.1 TaxID=3163029 RepID=UPI0039C9CAE1
MGQPASAGDTAAARNVTITFKPDTGLDVIHKAVEDLVRKLEPGGCTGCGLLGIDLILRSGDPEVHNGLNELLRDEGVIGVDVRH